MQTRRKLTLISYRFLCLENKIVWKSYTLITWRYKFENRFCTYFKCDGWKINLNITKSNVFFPHESVWTYFWYIKEIFDLVCLEKTIKLDLYPFNQFYIYNTCYVYNICFIYILCMCVYILGSWYSNFVAIVIKLNALTWNSHQDFFIQSQMFRKPWLPSSEHLTRCCV